MVAESGRRGEPLTLRGVEGKMGEFLEKREAYAAISTSAEDVGEKIKGLPEEGGSQANQPH